jgi:hypothetical protein
MPVGIGIYLRFEVLTEMRGNIPDDGKLQESFLFTTAFGKGAAVHFT